MTMSEKRAVRPLDGPPYRLDEAIYRRFDPRNTIFGRRHWDREAPFYGQDVHDRAGERMAEQEGRADAGYSRVEFARARAAWTVTDHFAGAYGWERLGEPEDALADMQPEVAPADEMAATVRATAHAFGADLVGICRVDPRWLYDVTPATVRDAGRYAKAPVPSGYDHAVVMALAMDAEAIRTSPGYAAATATGVGYSRMAFVASCLAQFIRNLGYRALPMGNDSALSIPLAIDAGLGQVGRNGLLVTPEFGPCVRLCKVLTDLPLAPDRPIAFGLWDTCRRCRRCAEACAAGAISTDAEPTMDVVSRSNNPGILRWPVCHDRCYAFWMQNGASCSSCIAACPYTPSSAKRRA
jgi:epoxyqueuosine reductase